MSVPTLKTAREALRNAIVGGTGLDDLSLTVFGNADDFPIVGDDIEPTIGDLPALMVMPGSLSIGPHQNISQAWLYQLPLELWTEGWLLPEAETLIEALILALHQTSATPGGVPYIKALLGRHPDILGVVQELTNLDGGQGAAAVRSRIAVQLPLIRNPYVPAG